MSRKDALLRLHQTLIARRNALQRKLMEELELTAAPADVTGDEAETAMGGAETEIHSQLAALESRELEQINLAIAAIRQGRYGLCHACGVKIPIARLNVLPFTQSCIDCQRAEEQLGSRSDRSRLYVNWETASEYEAARSEREIRLSDYEVE